MLNNWGAETERTEKVIQKSYTEHQPTVELKK